MLAARLDCRSIIAAALLLCAARPGLAQLEANLATTLVSDAAQFSQAPADGRSVDELVRRLEQTEAQLAAMQEERMASLDSRPLEGLRDHWEQVGDPSIVTVDQQTHQPYEDQQAKKKWYERLSIRGYAQFRINDVTAEEGAPAQHVGDRSVGDNQSFLIRRARLIVSGDVSDHLYVYLQPDFASAVPGSLDSNQFCQIRDWYGDVYLDSNKVYRIRVGQSKIPFGWENLQSSSNRLPLDRSRWDSTRPAQRARPGRVLLLDARGSPGPVQVGARRRAEGLGQLRRRSAWASTTARADRSSSRTTTCTSSRRLAVPYQFDERPGDGVGPAGLHGDNTPCSARRSSRWESAPAVRPLGTLETGERTILGRAGRGDVRLVSAAAGVSGRMERRPRAGA